MYSLHNEDNNEIVKGGHLIVHVCPPTVSAPLLIAQTAHAALKLQTHSKRNRLDHHLDVLGRRNKSEEHKQGRPGFRIYGETVETAH